MSFRARILTIVAAAMIGLLLMSGISLFQLRNSMMDERRAQINLLLDFADGQVKYFYEQEKSGNLSRGEAQRRAIEAISAQKRGSDYFLIRRLTDDFIVYHPDSKRMGKDDPGPKLPDGRSSAQAFRDGLASSSTGQTFVVAYGVKPGSSDPTPIAKLNGLKRFEPWGWMLVIGFFTDDIEQQYWSSATRLAIAGILILSVVMMLALKTTGRIISQLGGEPVYAAGISRSIANGDLSQTIESIGSEDSLLGSMKAMQSSLHDMVASFNQASATLAEASKTLTEETARISASSQKTSEATSSTAAAIEEMTVSINHISDNARETEFNSQHSAKLATEGEKLARKAAQEIYRISEDVTTTADLICGLVERSREIESMSSVIKEIADQTNLLALNAAIEAARAGEQGRGFAVVADEVRKLAERTGRATEDITRTIRAVQADTDGASARMEAVRGQVSHGVKLAEQAAISLREINAGAQATLEKTRDVANAAKEQSQASNAIANNVEQIAQMVEEAEASVVAAHAQVRNLDLLAKELFGAASRYKI